MSWKTETQFIDILYDIAKVSIFSHISDYSLNLWNSSTQIKFSDPTKNLIDWSLVYASPFYKIALKFVRNIWKDCVENVANVIIFLIRKKRNLCSAINASGMQLKIRKLPFFHFISVNSLLLLFYSLQKLLLYIIHLRILQDIWNPSKVTKQDIIKHDRSRSEIEPGQVLWAKGPKRILVL